MRENSFEKKSDLIKSLETLINNNKNEEACSIIDGVLSKDPPREDMYSDLVNILLLIPDYNRAKYVFERYKSITGKELISDFTLKEIIAEEEENSLEKKSTVKKYERMSISERGHFSNRLLFNPVISIWFTDENLFIKKRYSKERCYEWSELKKVFILRENAFKNYGKGTGGKYKRRTLFIIAGNDKYLIDVSSSFPDLKGTNQMLEEMRNHLSISEIDK